VCDSCSTKLHFHCATRFFQKKENPRCPDPKCGVLWTHEIPTKSTGNVISIFLHFCYGHMKYIFYLSHIRTWISNVICHGFFIQILITPLVSSNSSVIWVERWFVCLVDIKKILLNCWPSLIKPFSHNVPTKDTGNIIWIEMLLHLLLQSHEIQQKV
jgi:hypothetical protein